LPKLPAYVPPLTTYPNPPKVDAIDIEQLTLLSNQATMHNNQAVMMTNHVTMERQLETINQVVQDLKHSHSRPLSWQDRPEPYVKCRTRLHTHAENGSADDVEKDLGDFCTYIDHEMDDDNNSTALLLAVQNNNLEIVKTLLEYGVSFAIHANKLAWFRALMNFDSSVIKWFKESGLNIDIENNDNMTSLIWCLKNDYLVSAKYLIEEGANVNAMDEHGYTPLHLCATKENVGYVEFVNPLVNQGANVHAKTREGFTALHVCAQRGHLQVFKELIKAGADVFAEGPFDCTPLHLSASTGRSKITKTLIDEGADVRARDSDGCTPLHHCAGKGKYEVVKLLIDANADLNAKDAKNITPISLCATNGFFQIARILINAGADHSSLSKADLIKSFLATPVEPPASDP
jgi:ankyrin repeat protein